MNTIMQQTAMLALLRNDPLFAVVNEDHLDELLEASDIVELDDVFVALEGLFVVLEGTVELTQDGQTQVLETGTRWPSELFRAQAGVQCRGKGRTPCTLGVCALSDVYEILPGRGIEEQLEITRRLATLRSVHLFEILSNPQRRRLIQEVRSVRYDAGAAVCKEGDVQVAFVVAHGELSVFTPDGELIRKLKEGHVFGEDTLFSANESLVTVTAETDALLYVIPSGFFEPCNQTFRMQLKRSLECTAKVEYHDLFISATLGRGGSGVVRMAVHKSTMKRYALKSCSWRRIKRLKQTHAIQSEITILKEVTHPFIVKLVHAFRSAKNVHMLMELVSGIELFRALDILGILKKKDAQFYCASTALAMEYLHRKNIVFRDLKPENILLDEVGYIKVVDFGIAKKLVDGRTYTLLGTPQYMAPEVVLMKGYSVHVDTWALGVLLFEGMGGCLPFEGNTHFDILTAVLRQPVRFPRSLKDGFLIPAEQSARSIIQGLLEKKVEDRLGSSGNGYRQLKEHEFFSDFDWNGLLEHAIEAPLVPDARSHLCTTPDRTRSGSEDSAFASDTSNESSKAEGDLEVNEMPPSLDVSFAHGW